MAEMDCRDTKYINIVLLGESGVGKSTFINSCCNYMHYQTLRDVLVNELEILIPAKFEITDINFEQKTVEIGTNVDGNECLIAGKAATQDVKAYVFPIEMDNTKYEVRLIDTPGMGDERGSSQDETNCELILSYISQLKEIHAFCLLLKPNNARLDVFMNYCILQVLSRLDSSATKNVIFGFTNARGENFTPGKTYEPLKVFIQRIKEQKNIEIPLKRMNMFCFDNEAFRYVAAIQKKVQFEDFIYSATELSWNQSTAEVWRMLLYATNIPPHDLKKTISVNDAKTMASLLSKPAIEIVQLIYDNLRLSNEHREQLSEAKLTKDELTKKMHTSKIDIKITDLKEAQTVCSHDKCSSFYMVNGIRKKCNEKKCCTNCSAWFVKREDVGNGFLKLCSKISWWSGKCSECGHSYGTHSHIYYETEVFKQKIDESILPELNSTEEMVTAKETRLKELQEEQEEYEYERQFILQSCAIFDQYLKQNSIILFDKSIKEYMQYQIIREQAFSQDKTDATVNQLQKLVNDYEEEEKTLQKASGEDYNFSPEEIQERKETLFKLKHFGPKIKKLYDIRESNIKRNLQNKEMKVPSKGGWFKKLLKVRKSILY